MDSHADYRTVAQVDQIPPGTCRTVEVNGSEIAREAQMVMLDRSGSDVLLEANNEVTVLLLSGAPIDEPIVGHGPFVMNTEDEIRQAITDFNAGRFEARLVDL